jgi:hypothetical protein
LLFLRTGSNRIVTRYSGTHAQTIAGEIHSPAR